MATQTHTGGQPELSEPQHPRQQVESAHNTANNVFQTATEQLHMLKQNEGRSVIRGTFDNTGGEFVAVPTGIAVNNHTAATQEHSPAV